MFDTASYEKERFKNIISTFERTRIDELEKLLEEDENFLNLSKRQEKIFNEIVAKFPESKALAIEFMDIAEEMAIMYAMFYYKNGIMDLSIIMRFLMQGGQSINLNVKFA